MDMEWGFFGFSIVIGAIGLAGVRRERKGLLFLLPPALLALFFGALWFGLSLSDIACCFCVIAFCNLCGLREG